MTGISYSRTAFRTLIRMDEANRAGVVAALENLPLKKELCALGRDHDVLTLARGGRLVLRYEPDRIVVAAITGQTSPGAV